MIRPIPRVDSYPVARSPILLGRRRLFFAVLALAVAGCVQTNAVLLNPSAAPLRPIAPDSVKIFTTESELDTLDYTRVAIIEASGSGEYTSQAGMIEAMRKKAADLGANGILVPQINEPGAGAKVAAAVFGTGTQRKGSVVAIHIIGHKAKPAPPAG